MLRLELSYLNLWSILRVFVLSLSIQQRGVLHLAVQMETSGFRTRRAGTLFLFSLAVFVQRILLAGHTLRLDLWTEQYLSWMPTVVK